MHTIIRNFISVLRRFRIATLLNILGLTIAFTAFILIMIQVNHDLTYNRSIDNAHSIYRIESRFDNDWVGLVSRPVADAIKAVSPHIEYVGVIFAIDNLLVVGLDEEDESGKFRENYRSVTPEYPHLFGFDMVNGSRDALLKPEQVIIPYSMAVRMFGSHDPIGQSLFMETQMTNKHDYYTIGGVYRDFPAGVSVKNAIYGSLGEQMKEQWNDYSFEGYIQLNDPSNLAEVENLVDIHLREKLTDLVGDSQDEYIRFIPFTEIHFTQNVMFDMVDKSSRSTMGVLISIAFVLLIIAAINFTNFSMALTPLRIKSINTQKVMGAADSMLRRALLVEAFCVCLLSFLLSLGVAWYLSVHYLQDIVSANLDIFSHIPLLIFTALLSGVIALCAGLYPSYYITSFSPALALKGSFGLSPKGRVLRNFLVGFQYIASFVLLMGASFMYLQNRFMQTSSIGVETEQVIVIEQNKQIKKNQEQVKNELLAYPGIERIGYGEEILLNGDILSFYGRKYKDQDIQFYVLESDIALPEVLGIHMTEGRMFRAEDPQREKGAYIFNENARKKFNLEVGDIVEGDEVIGFMPDFKFLSFRKEVAPMAFYVNGNSAGSTFDYAYLKIAAGTDPGQVMDYIHSTLNKVDSGYPFDVRFMDGVIQQMYIKESNMMKLIGLFSLVAVFISIVGVFGLVIFESQYRIKEIGIRKVLGSDTVSILRMFNKTYFRIVTICFIIATPLVIYGINEWLQNFAYRTPLHWWVFAGAFLAITCVTSITVTFQNWQAANSNPVKTIKTE